MYKLMIFDVDGTLTTTKSGATFRKSADDWQWLPGRLSKLASLRQNGIILAYATNQGGVAYGYMQEDDMDFELARVALQGHMFVGGVCYTHPKATIEHYQVSDDINRKPAPGMLLDLMITTDVSKEETLMVGDRPEDSEAARRAGCAFMWAEEFFKEKADEEVEEVTIDRPAPGSTDTV